MFIVDIIIALIIALIAIIIYVWNRVVLDDKNSYNKTKNTMKELQSLMDEIKSK
jgi:uncharacterized protein YxeA